MKQWPVWLGLFGLGAVALQTTALNVRAIDREYGLGSALREVSDLDARTAHLRTRIRSITATERLEIARTDLGLSEDELFPAFPGWTPGVLAVAERR
ncbi:MAG: hypothetical protein ACF8XB_16080 [Planctomycetota bacterium JB042]